MIEKLKLGRMLYMDARPLIEKKINELIEEHNKLEKKHESLAYESDPLNRMG